MRFCRSLSLLFLCALASAQSGVYKASSGEESRWSVNPNHVLLWNATPYIPFGLRIGASEAEILAAKSAGIQDVVVDVPPTPATIKAAVASLERNEMRYVLCISTLAPTATGALIEPQGNRFSGITSKRNLDFRIAGAEEALVVLAVRRDGYIQKTYRAKGEGGRFSVLVEPPNDLDHVAMIYPITSSLAQLGAWESFDDHRDALLTSLQGASLGKGLRGILNPLGTFAARSGPRSFVPTGRLFRFEFESYLRQTFRNPQTCMRSWAMSGTSEKTWADLARMVPLWNGSRGVSQLWDPQDDQLYPCEMRRSTIWRDLDAVISTAEARRTERLIRGIRKVADVPILQEWVGWSPLYEGSPHGLDGLAARTSGATPSALAETAARAASSLLRWTAPGWFLATQVDMGGVPEPASQIGAVLDDLLSMGLRGGYVRTSDAALRGAIVQLQATRGQDMTLAQWSPKPVFFPEAAINPASPMRLPGGFWWLPAPNPGNRIDMGSSFSAYRIEEPTGTTVAIWSRVGTQRVKLHMATPRVGSFQTVDGSDPKPRIGRDSVEVTLSEMPLIVSGTTEIPIPEPAYAEMVKHFDALLAEAEKRKVDTIEERFYFKEYVDGYPRNPGGSFASMQTVAQKLSNRLARYMWVEAESVRESTFSEILAIPGVSGGHALSLRTQISTSGGEYTAEFNVLPRTDQEVECWVAARISPADREQVRLLIGGQQLAVEGEPVSGYGPGFAWYSFGKTRLGKAATKVTLKVLAPEGTDMAVDALLFYPGSFTPRGVRHPDAIPTPPAK
jgi:hypothetical protein